MYKVSKEKICVIDTEHSLHSVCLKTFDVLRISASKRNMLQINFKVKMLKNLYK